jgi:benzoyl-CoA reductase/2-hydroxyglutaryl-CoA dehydratase subunit BcrC/BadD/HgdB
MENCGSNENLCSNVWFGNMIGNCLQYATTAKAKGRPIVGIMCEYTPRELIMAADAIPVCLCGGSVNTIAAAEQDLPKNLCPLIKSTYGYNVLKKNPFLEMADLLVAETTCDGKKKMYELLSQSRPMHILELSQKSDDADAFEHWQKELLKFKSALEQRFNVKITDDKIRKSIALMNRERRLRRGLAEFMEAEMPPLTGRQLLDLKSIISGIDADLNEYEKIINTLKSKKAECGTAKKARVLLTGVPLVHGAERIIDLIEENSGLIVCMENCTGIKPILEDVDETITNPITALAKKYFNIPCSVMTKNTRRLETLRGLIKKYRPQCIIELIWQACLTYDVESHFIKQLAQQEFKLPYLKIETDYSPSDSARIKMRIEALFETIQK